MCRTMPFAGCLHHDKLDRDCNKATHKARDAGPVVGYVKRLIMGMEMNIEMAFADIDADVNYP